MDAEAETPLPMTAAPTPGDLLRRVAAAAGRPWFPSDHARDAGVPRDELDDPLNDLRNAGLVIVVDWVKGRGQGYGLTPDGASAASDPSALARALAAERPPPTPRDVPVAHPELPPAVARDPGGLTAFDRGELARQALFAPPPPVVTPILILANLAWFAAGVVLVWRSGGSVVMYFRGWETTVLARLGGVHGDLLWQEEWWRLATSCFVHGGGLHLLLNLYALGVIGPVAEGLWGRWRFALIYAWSGWAGACLAMALRPELLVVGASGAVWGVMAAVVAWLVLNRDHLPPEIVIEWVKTLGLVLAVNIAVSFAPRVSWEAHLGGAAVGFAAAVLANVVRPGLVRRRVLVPAALALGLAPAACVTALAVYAEAGSGWQSVRDKAAARELNAQRRQAGEAARHKMAEQVRAVAAAAALRDAVRRVARPMRIAAATAIVFDVGRQLAERVRVAAAAAAVPDAIRPAAVDAVYRGGPEWAAGGLKPAALAERSRALRSAAAAAADRLAADSRQGRAAAYAQAVADLAAALEAVAAAPDPPAQWRPIAEKKKLADKKWVELLGG